MVFIEYKRNKVLGDSKLWIDFLRWAEFFKSLLIFSMVLILFSSSFRIWKIFDEIVSIQNTLFCNYFTWYRLFIFNFSAKIVSIWIWIGFIRTFLTSNFAINSSKYSSTLRKPPPCKKIDIKKSNYQIIYFKIISKILQSSTRPTKRTMLNTAKSIEITFIAIPPP